MTADPTRRHASAQIAGPFEGYRLGATDVPVRIFDLSLDGCLVELSFGTWAARTSGCRSTCPAKAGRSSSAKCSTSRVDNAFAVKFIRLNDETRRRIERAIDRLLDRPPEDDAPVINGEANDD